VAIPQDYDSPLLRQVIDSLMVVGPNVALTDDEIVDRYILFVDTFKRIPKRTARTTLIEQAEDDLARQFANLAPECARAYYEEAESDVA
jgi:hypothetical protein